MSDAKELQNFMKEKTKEAIGEDFKKNKNEEEDIVKDAPKSVNQDSPLTDARSAKAMAMFRLILNALFIIPILLAIIGLFGYILIRVLPSTLYFIKQLIVNLMTR